jgi:WD40-like Beta Propeller Repeat
MLGTRTFSAAALAMAALGATTPADRAWADYGPGAIPASAAGRELGGGTAPALSGEGRYVAFTTQAPVLLGPAPNPDQYHSNGVVWKDLQTGEIKLVAPPERRWRSDGPGHSAGDLVDQSPRFSGSPSISADGRRVLFASTSPLATTDTNRNEDVYVRDMTRPLGQTAGGPDVRAYELVSARDGGESPPGYFDGVGSAPGEGGAALSDDGLTAVFVTEGRSTLPNGSGIAPRWQVFVRSLETRTTLLVTRDRQDATMPGTPVPPAEGQGSIVPGLPQPVLSGDGTTVVWAGSNANRQARFLPGEPQSLVNLLWRDVSAGPAAPTRRVSGVADPDDPACPPSFTWPGDRSVAERATGPCYGPFATGEAMDRDNQRGAPTHLSLSDDGLRVLFQSYAYLRPRDETSFRPGSIYLADMSPGVSRKQGTVRILSVPKESLEENRGVTELGMSGDGRHAAFSSRAAAFDGPRPVGSFQTGELDTSNVFMLDLAAGTVERVTRAASGGDYRGAIPTTGTGTGVLTDPQPRELVVADGGSAVAFTANDGNLFIGDGNDTLDVQIVRRSTSTDAGGPDWAAAAPPGPAPIDLTEPPLAPLRPVHPVFGHVRLGRGGVAMVSVRVPAAGRLTGRATGRRGGRRDPGLPVGRDGARPRRAATVTLRIRPSRAARRALRRRPHRVTVTLRLRYRPRVGPPSGANRRYTLGRRGGGR